MKTEPTSNIKTKASKTKTTTRKSSGKRSTASPRDADANRKRDEQRILDMLNRTFGGIRL
jgi:hypothetical protein